jgi:hypothetical protein
LTRLLLSAALLLSTVFPCLQAQPRNILALDRIEIHSESGAALPDTAALTDALLACWQKNYGGIAILAARRFAPDDSPRVHALLESGNGVIRARIRFAAPGTGEETLVLRVTPEGGASVPSVLAGGIFTLWARGTGTSVVPLLSPPVPAGLLYLDALKLLLADGEKLPDPVDVASTAGGPLLVFGRRILRLGPSLQVSAQTLRSLYFPPPLAPDQVIGAACLSRSGEPRLYTPQSGNLIYADHGGTAVFDTGLAYPDDTAALPGGGFALLKQRSLAVFRRAAGCLQEQRIELPPGLYSALAADKEDNIWVFDLAERRFRVFSPQDRIYRESRSVTPLLSSAEMPLPQTCVLMNNGAFLLGGSGTLFCFDGNGLPRWRLWSVPSRVREALPAAFRLALTPEEDGFYLLDAPGRRLFLFRDPGSLAAGTAEQVWAGAFPDFDPQDHPRLRAALAFLEKQRLLLQAYQPALLLGDPQAMARLEGSLRVRRAELSRALAEQLQAGHLLPEAEAALGAGLRLYHRLRLDDPVDERWPAAIRELSAARAALRGLLFAEPLLDISLVSSRLEMRPGEKAEAGLLAEIALRNNGDRPLTAIRLAAVLAGAVSSPVTLLLPGVLRSGQTTRAVLKLELESGLDAEAQLGRLAVKAVADREQGGPHNQYVILPLPLPGR